MQREQVGDATCNLGDVERVNRDQLHVILHDLLNTTYFRLFPFSSSAGPCPLDNAAAAAAAVAAKTTTSSSSSGSKGAAKKPPGGAAGRGLPRRAGGAAARCATATRDNPEGACGLLTSDAETTSRATLNSVDRTMSNREVQFAKAKDAPCNDENLPEFWLNLCPETLEEPSSGSSMLNLQLNPEIYTGYNGSHIWRAIYDATCLSQGEQECYEERVLQRLISAMHASTSIHIALHNKQQRKVVDGVNITAYSTNPTYFMKNLGMHPERIKNLHFAFVVLLRALRKAAPSLYHYPFSVDDDPTEDERIVALVQRLLDSRLLSSCSALFEAFDESLLFNNHEASIKRHFKHVFHNVSDILNCVTCSRCRLHGKLQLLGIGTALKILLLPRDMAGSSLSRNEIVALFNTLGQFSHSILSVSPLIQEYWDLHSVSSSAADEGTLHVGEGSPLARDAILAAISRAVKAGLLSPQQEDLLVDRALTKPHADEDLAALARTFGALPESFARHAVRVVLGDAARPAKAVVIGSGLAGLSASLTMLDKGMHVVLVEKEKFLGGNSVKASSGINAVDAAARDGGDSVDAFVYDILKSSKLAEPTPLMEKLAEESEGAITWVRERLNQPLPKLARLGGHSFARTHRPDAGMAGAEIIFALEKLLGSYVRSGALEIRKSSRAVELVLTPPSETPDAQQRISAVKVVNLLTNETDTIEASFVMLATGGFANDLPSSSSSSSTLPESGQSLVAEFAPHLLRFPTTNGAFTTGDGIKMARALGVAEVDMDSIQLHPTGFVDPAEPGAHYKVLCAELLRGVGGILLNSQGERFANELGTRDVLSQAILDTTKTAATPNVWLVLSASAAKAADSHVPFYVKRGLLRKYESVTDAAESMGLDSEVLLASLRRYESLAADAPDEFGKSTFPNAADLTSGNALYVGTVTPVLHYCQGGLAIDTSGRVLRSVKPPVAIPGLFAAGEVTGGLHGRNRLGGNSMTECVVFGRVVGSEIARLAGHTINVAADSGGAADPESASDAPPLRAISAQELGQHNSASDCWIALHGKVYDVTDFLDEHPAGPDSLLRSAGADATDVFDSVHTLQMLDDFVPIGEFAG